ncbi:Myb/SANT-like domain [Dillenia turbinata]|uniref:Myb/SANT-like domain n=1 Tax=Dillenia turbinata TaxID=194707 RepID=A0AAN8UFE6_9MAGN
MDNYENMTTSKKSKIKVVEENTKARCAKWDDYAHIKFVELCEEDIRKGNRPGSYLSKDGWRNLVVVFNQMTGRNYDKKQMKNHWDTIKSEWKLFKGLTHWETRLGFDAARNTIRVDDEWWEKKIAKFRNNDLYLFWYRYDAIFSNIVATGHRARAPNQTNLMHDDINEDEEGYEVEDHDIEEIDKSDDSLFDVQNIRGIDNTFTSDESLFPPTFNIKTSGASRLKEDIQSLLKLMSTMSTSTFSSGSQDGPTIVECLDILKNLPGVELGSGLWFYACDLFAKKEQREIFFRQSNNELKLGWLQ